MTPVSFLFLFMRYRSLAGAIETNVAIKRKGRWTERPIFEGTALINLKRKELS
jgi:hypothetical protein